MCEELQIDRLKYIPPKPKHWYYIYPFYDVKDGDDCLQKIFYVSTYSGVAGTTFALMAGLTSTTIDNPALGSNILIRLAKYGLPMLAAGAVFSGTTCAVANLRGGVDDPYNHFWGGMATGSVVGTALKSQKAGWGWGIFLGLSALVWKAGKIEGFTRIDWTQVRREKSLDEYRRSYFTERPNPEGDPNI